MPLEAEFDDEEEKSWDEFHRDFLGIPKEEPISKDAEEMD